MLQSLLKYRIDGADARLLLNKQLADQDHVQGVLEAALVDLSDTLRAPGRGVYGQLQHLPSRLGSHAFQWDVRYHDSDYDVGPNISLWTRPYNAHSDHNLQNSRRKVSKNPVKARARAPGDLRHATRGARLQQARERCQGVHNRRQ